MSKIPTAEDVLKKYIPGFSPTEKGLATEKRAMKVIPAMIEFAKLHVTAALEVAANNAKWEWRDYEDPIITKSSILNAYPLTNIK